jgi:2,4-dienoyl-CoA reductase-like NADH-dependent reductase (Old Yellow Enzyme family)/thioredoxin reductase
MNGEYFRNLFSPLKAGRLELKNRITMLPVTTGFNEVDETVGNRFIRFYAERAKGGVGMISVPFSPIATGGPFEPGLYDDRFIEGALRLTDSVHAFGTKIFAEFIISYHVSFKKGHPEIVGPSPVWNSVTGCMPRPLTIDEIKLIVEKHADAAHRAQKAGFDAVELLLGAGYLLGRFISPLSNIRDDCYGGNPERRMQIVIECIEAIKSSTTGGFPVSARVTVDELIEGGRTMEDTREIVRTLEKAGIQTITFHIGAHESRTPTVQPCVPRGGFAHLAGRIKEWVGVPVVAANRINDPHIAERILAEGKADLIGMGRALIADPELPNKSREGRTDEIVPCLACSNCLSAVIKAYRQWGTHFYTNCKVNPLVGKEGEYIIKQTERRKKVLVIGGGPAGLEAARVAAQRGHQVILYEKGKQLGGRLLIGAVPPHKEDIRTLFANMAARTGKAGVTIKLDIEAGREVVGEEKPDVLIVAVGAKSFYPPIPGVIRDSVVFAEDVLSGSRRVSGKVVIIGGGMVGCETAEFLTKNLPDVTEVTVLEMKERLAEDMSTNYRPFFLGRLREAGVKLITNVKVEEITEKGVRITRVDESQEFFESTAIVLAVGLRARGEFVEDLMGMAAQSYAIGDCVNPASIKEAIEQGFLAGNSI